MSGRRVGTLWGYPPGWDGRFFTFCHSDIRKYVDWNFILQIGLLLKSNLVHSRNIGGIFKQPYLMIPTWIIIPCDIELTTFIENFIVVLVQNIHICFKKNMFKHKFGENNL